MGGHCPAGATLCWHLAAGVSSQDVPGAGRAVFGWAGTGAGRQLSARLYPAAGRVPASTGRVIPGRAELAVPREPVWAVSAAPGFLWRWKPARLGCFFLSCVMGENEFRGDEVVVAYA